MTKALKPGDKVRWRHSQGETTGKVVKRVTAPTRIKDHKVAAATDHPEFIVRSDKTGALAAHEAKALKKA